MFILLGGELACIEYFILTANCTVCKDCTYFKNDLRVFDKSEQIGLYKFIKNIHIKTRVVYGSYHILNIFCNSLI